jgi:TonB family protein
MRTQIPLLLVSLLVNAGLAHAANKQQVADSLLARANQLSNIRTDGSPAFKLTAKFNTTDREGSPQEGTYEEIWVSNAQWKQEISLPNFHRVELANDKRFWTTAEDRFGNSTVRRLESLSGLSSEDILFAKPDKITDRVVLGKDSSCLIAQPDAAGGRSAACFDKNSGAVVERIYPYHLSDKILDEICRFMDYQTFGNKLFPRSVQCFKEGKETWRMRFELTPVSPDAQTFVAPPGAIESVNCMGSPIAPPKPTHTPDPAYPTGEREPTHPVVLWVLVGTDGKPGKVEVARTVSNPFDDAAVSAVQRWKFQPAMCRGVAVPAQINVEISFRR